ncbi:MAG: dimethyladenosine transferase [Acidimicrobiia bacterium]|nr:dimethyladenosine transferase [Acidimicrobiia bacterium]
MTTERSVSASRVIAAPPAKIFDVLADPSRHCDFDGSDSVLGAKGDPPRLTLGARFGMRMRIHLPYSIKNTVVEFEEGRRIGWRHFGRHVWRYELEPVDGGTRVTETFDWAPALWPAMLERTGAPKKNLAAIEATLQRLDRVVTAESA